MRCLCCCWRRDAGESSRPGEAANANEEVEIVRAAESDIECEDATADSVQLRDIAEDSRRMRHSRVSDGAAGGDECGLLQEFQQKAADYGHEEAADRMKSGESRLLTVADHKECGEECDEARVRFRDDRRPFAVPAHEECGEECDEARAKARESRPFTVADHEECGEECDEVRVRFREEFPVAVHDTEDGEECEDEEDAEAEAVGGRELTDSARNAFNRQLVSLINRFREQQGSQCHPLSLSSELCQLAQLGWTERAQEGRDGFAIVPGCEILLTSCGYTVVDCDCLTFCDTSLHSLKELPAATLSYWTSEGRLQADSDAAVTAGRETRSAFTLRTLRAWAYRFRPILLDNRRNRIGLHVSEALQMHWPGLPRPMCVIAIFPK